ncbi:MAG TPA: HIT family protein [Patescibacteria group bacterium]
MYNHALKDEVCPICLGVRKIENAQTLIRQSDIVYQDEDVTAFISSFFIGNNKGHVVIVPNQHFENIYDLPEEVISQIQKIAKKLAIAVRGAYSCEGITLLQNNEPAGNQHAFHYHLHIFPRYQNDELYVYMLKKTPTTPKERLPYAEKLKTHLKNL